MVVDLRSDTVTKPSKEMLDAMMVAPVGDDVFNEDPSINALEEKMAKMFGHNAALFVPSGTMANQIAIKSQTRPIDEIIAHEISHIYYYETAGYAFNSGVSIKLTKGNSGIMTPKDIEANIQEDYDWLPNTSLVTIENTCNKGGGNCYELDNMIALSTTAKKHNLKIHLDGARVFNAIAYKGYNTADIGPLFNSITICFSKGLGAPVGSILISDQPTIKRARKIRKVLGGGMRQAGLLAAACDYAIENNIAKLKNDHQRAKLFGEILQSLNWVKSVYPIETNIVLFDVAPDIDIKQKLKQLDSVGVRLVQFGPKTIRAVFHLDITDTHLNYVEEKLKQIAY